MSKFVRIFALLTLLVSGYSYAQGPVLTLSPANPVAGQPITFTCTLAGSPGATVYYNYGTPNSTPYLVGLANSSGATSVTTNLYQPGNGSAFCGSSGIFSAGIGVNVAADPNLTFVESSVFGPGMGPGITDASGAPLANGTICFTPVNAQGQPTPYNINGVFAARPSPVCRTVTNGNFGTLLMLGRSDRSIPVGVNYAIDVTDASTGAKTRMGIAAISGDKWAVSQFAPTNVVTAPPAAWVVGPQGTPGPATIAVGTTTTVPSGTPASVANTGSNLNAIFSFNVPAGPPGPMGPAGSVSAAGAAGTFQVASSTGSLAAATPAMLNTLMGYTPVNPANNGSEFTNKSALLGNIGAASVQALQMVQNTANAALPLSGGTLLGPVNAANDTPTGTQLADANYVQAQLGVVAGVAATLLPKAGGTMTGPITLAADPASALQPATKQYVDAKVVSGGSTPAVGFSNALQTTDGSGHLTADNYVGVGVDHSIVALGPRVDVRDSLFAAGTGLPSPNQGTNCVGVDANPTGLADPTNTYNSECAIRNAAIYAQHYTVGNMTSQLYFPRGHYKVSVFGTTAVLRLTAPIGITGDDRNSSVIENDSPNAALITYVGTYSCEVKDISVQGSGSNGNGSLLEYVNAVGSSIHNINVGGTAGIALNFQGGTERTRVFDLNGGGSRIALNANGNTNENYFHDLDLSFNGYSNMPGYTYWYDSNANPMTGVHYTDACTTASGAPAWSGSSVSYAKGQTVTYGGLSYNAYLANTSSSSNTPQYISSTWNACGQTPRPEGRAIVYLDGDNLSLEKFSLKGTGLSGVRMARSAMSMQHGYFEAGNNTNAQSYAYAFQVNGKEEIARGTAAVSASSLVFPIDDAGWQHSYVSDPQDVLAAQQGAIDTVCVYPADYVEGGTAVSAYVPGLLTGQKECMSGIGYSSDNSVSGNIVSGSAHVLNRAIRPWEGNGYASVAPGVACGGGVTANCGPGIVNTPVAWPAPVTISGVTTPSWLLEQNANVTGSTPKASDNHIDMLHPNGQVGVCDNNAILPLTGNWINNPSNMCAEIFLGTVPDGLGNQLPGKGQALQTSYLEMDNNAIGNGQSEQVGHDWVKIPVDGTIIIHQGNGVQLFPFNPQTLTQYTPTFGTYEFVHYTSLPAGTVNGVQSYVSAQGQLTDVDADVHILASGTTLSNFNSLSASVQQGGAGTHIDHQYIGGGDHCELSSYFSDLTTPTNRRCYGSDGGVYIQQNGSTTLTLYGNGNITNSGVNNFNGTTNHNGPLNIAGGLFYNLAAFVSGNTTLAQGQSEAFLQAPAGGLTLTLPIPAGQGQHVTITSSNGNPWTLYTGSGGGSLYLNGTNYGQTVAFNSARAVSFVSDGFHNWYSDSYISDPSAVTVSSGAGLGTLSGSIAVAPGSTAHAGQISYTTTAAGTSGSAALTFRFATTLANAPMVCNLIPQSAASATVMGNHWPSVPTTSGWVETATSAWPAGTYAWGYTCAQQQ